MEQTVTYPELVVLVRHGESLMNVAKNNNIFLPEETAGLVRGIPDHKIPLTERGRLQARQTGIEIRRKFGIFDVSYDSGYARTIQTREEALAAYTPEELAQMKLRTSHLIREREAGYTFNMTDEEAKRNFPYLQEYWNTFGPFYARPPGGQSQADKCNEVALFKEHLRRYRAGKKVIVFNHGITMRAIRFNFEGWTADQYMEAVANNPPFANCSVTTYRFNHSTHKLELEELNQVYWKL